MSENGQLKMLPLDQITENPVALRSVNKQTEAYLGLVDSIKNQGILNPIVVRELHDPETGNIRYAVVDGLHRFTAAGDAGLKEIPVYVKDLHDAEVWLAQIIANVQKVETSPHQYAQQLRRIFTADPLLTASELGVKLSKSPSWISQMLGLTKVKDDKLAKLIDKGKICLSNAYALSKLPEDEQTNFADRAMTMSPAEFVPLATERAKAIADARRKGRSVEPEQFVALPKFRKSKEVKNELGQFKTGPSLLQELNVTDPLEAWKLAVKWVLCVDPKSIEVRKQEDEDKRKKKEEEKKKLAAEKARIRADEAAKKAAELSKV